MPLLTSGFFSSRGTQYHPGSSHPRLPSLCPSKLFIAILGQWPRNISDEACSVMFLQPLWPPVSDNILKDALGGIKLCCVTQGYNSTSLSLNGFI